MEAISHFLKIQSSYHPQTDDQIEIVNRSLGNMPRCLVGEQPKQWHLALPQAEFAYNNFFNKTTRMSPFSIVYTKLPNYPIDLFEPSTTSKGAANMA